MRKAIMNQEEWDKVIFELENEHKKLQAYDYLIIRALGDVKNLKILDYGSGPGVMAAMLHRLGADIKLYDTSKEMREIATDKFGRNRVFNSDINIPNKYFDIILCNLVLCIINEEDVAYVLRTIAKKLAKDGSIYTGFCNPLIFDIKESRLDYRFPTGECYECNHDYKKIKKEGDYEITERHRPIEWYTDKIRQAGLSITKQLFTPTYEMNGYKISDFIIFELNKE